MMGRAKVEQNFIEEFIDDLRCKGRDSTTCDEYRTNLNEYMEYLSAGKVFSFFGVTEEVIRNYYRSIAEYGYASSTVWKKQHAVYAFYEWLREEYRILLNPCMRPMSMVKVVLPHEVPTWEKIREAYVRLHNSPRWWEQRDLMMIDLAYSCGLRRCELHRLNIEDINQDDGIIKLYGKGRKERVVPIGEKGLKNLLHYLYHVRPRFLRGGGVTNAVFVSWMKGGKRMNIRSINSAFRRLHKAYGFDRSITPHNLRHAFATDLIRNGAPVQDVSKMLGHEKLETTQIFTRLFPSDLKKHHKKYHPRG